MDLLIKEQVVGEPFKWVLPLDWIAPHLSKNKMRVGGGMMETWCSFSSVSMVYGRSRCEWWNYFMWIWLRYFLSLLSSFFFPLSWRMCWNAPHRPTQCFHVAPRLQRCRLRSSLAGVSLQPTRESPSSPACPIWLHMAPDRTAKSKSLFFCVCVPEKHCCKVIQRI